MDEQRSKESSGQVRNRGGRRQRILWSLVTAAQFFLSERAHAAGEASCQVHLGSALAKNGAGVYSDPACPALVGCIGNFAPCRFCIRVPGPGEPFFPNPNNWPACPPSAILKSILEPISPSATSPSPPSAELKSPAGPPSPQASLTDSKESQNRAGNEAKAPPALSPPSGTSSTSSSPPSSSSSGASAAPEIVAVPPEDGIEPTSDPASSAGLLDGGDSVDDSSTTESQTADGVTGAPVEKDADGDRSKGGIFTKSMVVILAALGGTALLVALVVVGVAVRKRRRKQQFDEMMETNIPKTLRVRNPRHTDHLKRSSIWARTFGRFSEAPRETDRYVDSEVGSTSNWELHRPNNGRSVL